MKYSLEPKESVVKKLLPPESRPVTEVSEEEEICTAKLFNWRKAARIKVDQYQTENHLQLISLL